MGIKRIRGETTMKDINEESKDSQNDQVKSEPVPETRNSGIDGKLAQNLGDGRWQYHGKTYKEQAI